MDSFSTIEIVMIALGSIIFSLLVMLALRQFNLWYWRINDLISQQKELIDILKPKPSAQNPIPATWICQACNTENVVSDHYCKKCKSEKVI